MSRLVFAVVFYFLGKAGFAQEASDLKHVIKTNPIFSIAGEMNLAYERALSPASSLELQGGYFVYDLLEPRQEGDFYVVPTAVDGWGTRLTYKRFFKHKAPLGGYLAVQGMFKHISADSLISGDYFSIRRYNFEKRVLGLKILLGKQLRLRKSSLLFDFYAGVSVKRHMKFYNVYLHEHWEKGIILSYSSYNDEQKKIIPSIHAGVSIGLGF